MTAHPAQDKYVFIHGPKTGCRLAVGFSPSSGSDCAQRPGKSNLDAMDITAPYTAGALRGSHVHVFSPNGQFVTFTKRPCAATRDPQLDLRNGGVAAPFGPVNPQGNHPREYAGTFWSVLVSRTTPNPQPGSDEINRA
ncbi:MAG: DUF3748 domain-containing protein [Enterobacter hormaechei]